MWFCGVFDGFAKPKDPFQRAMAVKGWATAAGFQWKSFDQAIRHLKSEVDEFRQTVVRQESPARQLDELGDVLFITTSLAQMQRLSPNNALNHASNKFIHRFQTMENIAEERKLDLKSLNNKQWRHLWNMAKRRIQKEV